ncbi:MAG TPA: carboxypeptidase-like regulatory domain-containing protein, partial [Candidatus Blautia merdigallinarum]|nr:carboxypeptidase-like regulatory domain-containing protein [Candidatus Blautia merdigallinarum]
MKGKWKIKKYIIVFILIFTIVLKMPLESLGTEVLAVERETVQEEIAADPVYTISGTVTANGVKVEGAFISVEGHESTAKTNEQGAYSISGLCPGEYTLIVSKEGFEQRKISITVMEGEKDDIQPIEPIKLDLKRFVISANTQEIFVNESLQFSYISELPENEIKAIDWKTADPEILDIDEKGNAIGKKAGNTSAAATFYTKYGLWISEPVSVTVNLRPVKLSLAVEPPDPGADQRVREIVLRAAITDNEGRPLDEGEVLFTVIRAADSNLGEPENTETYTAKVKAGEAVYTLRKNAIDFYGTYTFTARYTGVENKYSESAEIVRSYNYTTDPIKFFDEKGEEISSTEEYPLQITYGNTESVYLKNEDNIEYSAQIRNNPDGTVKITKQEVSDKEGYTEFVIN